MSAGAPYDAGAPTIEVRIYRDDQILVRELVETEEDAEALVDRWSDVGNIHVLVDDLSARHGPADVLAPDELLTGDDDDRSIDSAVSPGRGTE